MNVLIMRKNLLQNHPLKSYILGGIEIKQYIQYLSQKSKNNEGVEEDIDHEITKEYN